MMTDKTTITDLVCKNAKPQAMRYEIADATRTGFRLSVQKSGAKSLILRYTFKGEYKNMILAPYTSGGNALKIALAAYSKAQDALAAGQDPKAALRPKADPDAALSGHIANFKKAKVAAGDWREQTRTNFERILDRLDADFTGRPIRSIAKSELAKWLDKIADKFGTSSAIGHRKVIRCFFQWVESREDHFENPARVLASMGEDREGERVLSDPELRAVWNAALKVGGATSRFIRLLMLTGCRRHEITDLALSEIEGDEIVLPGERTKNETEHRIPITPAMRAVLRECPMDGPFAINGKHTLGDHSGMKAKLDEYAKLKPWRFHDVRRSVVSGMARIGIAPHVIEKCVNHKSGTFRGIVGVYQKHDFAKDKREAFAAWSDHIEAIVTGAKIKAAA